MKLPFSLDGFKKVDANRDHTVFQSEAGHLIYVANKSLSKEVHEALRKLPMDKRQEPQKMAQGGVVKAPGTKQQQDKVSEGFKNALGFKKMADGGIVEEEQRRELNPALKAVGETLSQGVKDVGKAYGLIGEKAMDLIAPKVPQAQGTPAPLDMPEQQVFDDAKLSPEQIASSGGMSGPSNFDLGATPSSGGMQGSLPSSMLPSDLAEQALGQFNKATNKQAGLQGELANVELDAMKAQEAERAQLDSARMKAFERAQQSYMQLQQAMDTNTVDPTSVWNSKSTLGVALTAIGALLGGAPVGGIIRKALDSEVDAQARRQEGAKARYETEKAAFKDFEAAAEDRSLQLNASLQSILKKETLKRGSPAAKAAAEKLQAEFLMPHAEEIMKRRADRMAKDQMQAFLGATRGQPLKNVQELSQAALRVVPEKEQTEASKEIETVRGADAAVEGVRKAFTELKSLGSVESSIPYSNASKRFATANAKIISAIRAGMKGQGALSDQEIKDTIIPLLAGKLDSVSNINSAEQAVIDTIISKRDQNIGTLTKYGLVPHKIVRKGPKPQGM